MGNLSRTSTIEDVAALAKVSRQTVSNVINRPSRVSESTAQRVRQAIETLNYRPNLGARRLRTNQSRTIGVRLEGYGGGIQGAVLDRFLHGLTQVAAAHEHRILIYAADSAAEEIAVVGDLVQCQDVDAVVLSGTFRGDTRQAAISAMGIECVAFGRPWSGRASGEKWVDVDGAAGVRLATQAAIDGSSLPPAYLGWPHDGATASDRHEGWSATMQEASLPTCGLDIVAEGGLVESRAAVRDALQRGLAERCGAIICASDLLAVAAQIELSAVGRTDIPVTGFDNTPVTEVLGISSIEQRPETVAARIIEMIVNPEAPQQVLVEPELMLR